MEDSLSVATQQRALSKKQLSAEGDSKEEMLPAWQQRLLQLLCLPRNGNSTTYDWYKDRVKSHAEGTCQWLLQHESFQKWLSQESGPLLVSADPGCGKSVLAKYLIDHGLAQQSATICYFFFNYQNQNTICQALCALLHQLFSQKKELIQHAMGLYDKLGAALVQSETSLWTILKDAVCDSQAGPIIFVIDALDECDESQLSSLISNLEDMFRDQQLADAKFKVIMTSRSYQHVSSQFYNLQAIFPRIHICGEEELVTISQEINSLIHHRIEKLVEKHHLSDKTRSSLNSRLFKIDHHTHLWVYLVFEYLDEELRKAVGGPDAAIQTLPETVNQAYEQILNRSRDDETVKTVKKALCIILAARRPLTISEMNVAMTLNGQGRGRSIYDLQLEHDVAFKFRLRALCGVFVHVHHDRIYLLHQTAREFLLQSSPPTTISSDLQWQHSITTRHAHSVLAEICLYYLTMLNATDTDAFCEVDHRSALFQYSVGYWDFHCREAEFEKRSTIANPASRPCSSGFPKWFSIMSDRYQTRPDSSTDILVASQLGFTPITNILLIRGADIEAKDSQGRTALMLAAECGHEDVAQLLVENGADARARDDDGRTVLMYAAQSGCRAILRLLLENGAHVQAKDSKHCTALILAAESGHEFVTWLLIANGADVKAKDIRDWTVLMLAAESGHKAVTRLLLEIGADIEARADDGRTALIVAIESGHAAVIRLLLDNGASIESRVNGGETALMHAAKFGNEDVARLLLEIDANIEAKDNMGSTALMIAARLGHEAVTQLLLGHDANAKAKDNKLCTALMHAVGCGREDVTLLLLENGVDVDDKDCQGRTALSHAAKSGHVPVTRLLLEKGAAMEARDDDGWTAFMYASIHGRISVTWFLLDIGVDVEARDSLGRTALMIATGSGDQTVTRLLLENGFNVDARDDDGQTSLIYAATNDDEGMTRLLIENDANIEVKDTNGCTALMCAAGSRHGPITRFLLDNDADIEAKDRYGWTAFMHAAYSGHEPVTRLLLEKGAYIKAEDVDSNTALMLAAESGHDAVTRLLLENGADVEAKDKFGMTAWMIAFKHGNEAIARILLDHAAQVEAKDVKASTA